MSVNLSTDITDILDSIKFLEPGLDVVMWGTGIPSITVSDRIEGDRKQIFCDLINERPITSFYMKIATIKELINGQRNKSHPYCSNISHSRIIDYKNDDYYYFISMYLSIYFIIFNGFSCINYSFSTT